MGGSAQGNGGGEGKLMLIPVNLTFIRTNVSACTN